MNTRAAAWRRIGAMILCLCLLFMSVPVAGAMPGDPLDSAVFQLRQAMVERETEVSITVQTEGPLVAAGADFADPLSKEMLGLLIQEIYNRAIAYTGKGMEGDYILWHLSQQGGGVQMKSQGNTYTYAFTYTFVYHTNAQQEEAVKAQADAVLSQLALSGKSDYEKVKAIYEYICANVTYDHTNLNDESYTRKYSAYAALINKTSVCQGYANLFYLLANQAGLDARIISGVSNGQPHAWNIVRLGGRYYNVDCTWDAGRTEQEHFLRGSDNFSNHQADDRYTGVYAIAKTDYTVGQPEEPYEPVPTAPVPTVSAPTAPAPTDPEDTEPAPTDPEEPTSPLQMPEQLDTLIANAQEAWAELPDLTRWIILGLLGLCVLSLFAALLRKGKAK